ncbi:phenylacetate--CoA ligase family protein [bacterium]|nr:phenylacetate--CoA ligase family protein [bacterium]
MDWRWLGWQLYDGEIWRPTAAAYDALLQSQWASPAELAALRAERLELILRYALETVPYYRGSGLPARLESFPVITRQTLRDQAAALQPEHAPPGRISRWQTGGSTGEPVTVSVDIEAQATRRAALLRGDLWGSRLRPTDPQAGLWASSRDSGKLRSLRARLYDRFFNRFVFNCFEMTPARAREVNQDFADCGARLLYGPSSAVLAFMHFAREAGIEPWQFEKVIPCGEHCSAEDALEMSAFFGGFAVDRYASNEFGPIASRCEYRNWHLNSELLAAEVLLDDGSISTAGRGRLLLTSLCNRAMPLIRYELGDFADLSPLACPCGRGLQTFSSLEGRITDHIRCPDQRWVNLCTFNSYFQHLPLRKYRFVIEAQHRISFLLQADQDLPTGDLDSLRAHFETLLGEPFRFTVRQVAEIPSLPAARTPM